MVTETVLVSGQKVQQTSIKYGLALNLITVTEMQREIKKKTIISGIAAAILALVLATTVTAGLYPLIEETFFYPSESTDQESGPLPPMSEAIPVSIDELSNNPSGYHLKRVTVSGTVSQLGSLRGPYFYLDEEILVRYVKEDNTFIDISNVKNGDHVTVTGRFLAPNTIYAENIEKA